MIKIFQVVECGGPGETGEQVASICNGLDPAKFDVSLVYSVRSGSAAEYRAKCSGAKAAYYVPELTREIEPARDATALRNLHRLFKEHKPDVVHAHSSKAGVLARAAAKSAGVKKIFYTPHTYAFLMPDRAAASRALYRTIEKAAARIGATIAASPSEAEQARKLGAKRVAVVRDAHLGGFPEPKAHEGLVVGSLGAMNRARNPDAWVLLAQRLCDSRNGLSCLWVGGGEDEAAAHENLTNMNLLSKVEVTGWLPADAGAARAPARARLVRPLLALGRHAQRAAGRHGLRPAGRRLRPSPATATPRRATASRGLSADVKNEVELLERCPGGISRRRRPCGASLGACGREAFERLKREHSAERRLSELSRLYSDPEGSPASHEQDKVFLVLECAVSRTAPATRSPKAIARHLDSAKFETTVVYAVSGPG